MENLRDGGYLFKSFLVILLLFGHASLWGRGKRSPQALSTEIVGLAQKQAADISALMSQLRKMPLRHGKFVTKDFTGVSYDRWFIAREGDYRNEYPILHLAPYPVKTWVERSLYVTYGEACYVRKIGDIPIQPDGYPSFSKRTVLIDMRGPAEMLVEAYSRLGRGEKLAEKGPMAASVSPASLKSLREEVFRFLYRLKPIRPTDWVWRSRGLNSSQAKRAIEKMTSYWKPLEEAGRKKRRLWGEKFSHFEPSIIRSGHFLRMSDSQHPKQSQSAKGSFATASEPADCVGQLRDTPFTGDMTKLLHKWQAWRQKCIDDPALRFIYPYYVSLSETIEHKDHYGVLAVTAVQHRFGIAAQGKEKTKLAYSFQEILERMVEKGRAVKLAAAQTPFWDAAREILRGESPEGWIVYADAPEEGKDRGAVLFNVKKGIGVWQPALYHAVKSLEPSAEAINRSNAEIFHKVVLFEKLTVDRAVKSLKKQKDEEAVDRAF